MIEIKTLATGSKGNCYHITDGSTPLLLECGISFKQIQQGLNFETSSLGGVFVTHEHKDHCKGVESVLNRGLDVYMSKGTQEALQIQHHRIVTVESKQQFRVGTWTILPFDVQHDVNEPLGFLLQSDNGSKMLFATDTYYVKYRFTGLTHIMIECNYDQQTLDDNVESGRIHPAMRKRVMKSHFSLENLLEFFRANDLSKVEEIHLLHLSDGNSNVERIFKAVARVTGKMIYIP
ncbi:MBL fold metallo-hydrolase [Lysinibacillus sp. CD3-6]|uniref:MBL fold metallo-hydrolase n=1 Tax=Lysinibacillus sp. CD3-6 TaxID=2892541 RepID=UPI0011219760|nr:MBL fold metallo-hydrolase [Lysinibacillus sp. CD3-6]UED81053.1 MBL fold metallo-hydrolase [Lysinibacillus sp. CD3-6]